MSYSTEKRREWIAAGICSTCGKKPPVVGGKNCEGCRQYYRNYRAMLRAKGICKCGRLAVEDGKNCEKCRATSRKNNREYRHQCIMAYGGYKCSCPGCDVTMPEFLEIDHIKNDGAEHRRKFGNGNSIYRWLIKNNFPPGFQILCANCNRAKGFYGGCPHNTDKDVKHDEQQNSESNPLHKARQGRGYLLDIQRTPNERLGTHMQLRDRTQ